MLDVSFNLVACMTMLISMVMVGFQIEVDSLNSPTGQANPVGAGKVSSPAQRFKGVATFLCACTPRCVFLVKPSPLD